MNKKDIAKLENWTNVYELEFDFIYIVPTSKQNCDRYKLAYYIWKIWNEYKIIDIYDCGSIFLDTTNTNSFILNWDFEDIIWWIKFWSNYWKIKYQYWWRIAPDIK